MRDDETDYGRAIAAARAAGMPSDGHLWVSALTSFPEIPRAVAVADVPDRPLPDVPSYRCLRVDEPIVVDGRLDEDAWSRAEWSSSFGRIGDGLHNARETRIALLWDDTYLYAGYRVEDLDIRGTVSRHHEHHYVFDDDVEIFVHGDGGYYELGVNPINTVYELRWSWLERIIASGDHEGLDRLLRLSDALYYAPRGHEKYGRIADLAWELPGLKHAVHLDGTLNTPAVRDTGWTVEFALPWVGLQNIGLGAPQSGLELRVQGYRAFHDREDEPADRSIPTPFGGYTWSVMGNGNVHNPERWAVVTLSDEVV